MKYGVCKTMLVKVGHYDALFRDMDGDAADDWQPFRKRYGFC